VISTQSLDMEVIVNPKSMDGGLNVVQLETAVERNRNKCPPLTILAREKCSDLLLIMSNLYTMSNGSLVMSPERMFATTPLIKLGDNHFKK
ncbi:Uncharacterized protein FKW44_013014, partial [Caligus rogercresseyi]